MFIAIFLWLVAGLSVLFLLCFVAIFLLLFVLALRHRWLVQPFVPVDAATAIAENRLEFLSRSDNPYSPPQAAVGHRVNLTLAEMTGQAMALGFQNLGDVQVLTLQKNSSQPVRNPDALMRTMMSSDSETMVNLMVTKANTPVHYVALLTFFMDGRSRVTNGWPLTQPDPSGMQEIQLVRDSNFPTMWEAHRKWVANPSSPAVGFSGEDLTRVLSLYWGASSNEGHEQGFCRYEDEARTIARFTWKGAWREAVKPFRVPAANRPALLRRSNCGRQVRIIGLLAFFGGFLMAVPAILAEQREVLLIALGSFLIAIVVLLGQDIVEKWKAKRS